MKACSELEPDTPSQTRQELNAEYVLFDVGRSVYS